MTKSIIARVLAAFSFALIIWAVPGTATACNGTSASPSGPPDKSASTSPETAVLLGNDGAPGCNGVANREENGFPGQAGGNSTQTTQPADDTVATRSTALGASSSGGAGGNGANKKGTGLFPNVKGGLAGSGGDAATATQTLGGAIIDRTAAATVVVRALGGNGGIGGSAVSDNLGSAQGRDGGAGGKGGQAKLTAETAISKTAASDITSLVIDASGGQGGNGGSASLGAKGISGNGGAGGQAGSTVATIGGLKGATELSQIQGSVIVRSNGGNGGNAGGDRVGGGANSGSGGAGGAGGTATATLQQGVEVSVRAKDSNLGNRAGVLVQANGGIGGTGGDAHAIIGKPGGGGTGGIGGNVSAFLGGQILTAGDHLHGALAQSIGGGGATGGSTSSLFNSQGARGGTGGNAGDVLIKTFPGNRVRTEGANAIGLVAQSLGGGGGSGGNATTFSFLGGVAAIGGNAGAGGSGGTATILLGAPTDTLGSTVITSISPSTQTDARFDTIAGGGVLAQSIGGAGGNGGSALAAGGATLNLAIGAQGAAGGAASSASINNQAAIVTTYGDHAVGLDAQSIGGGGGKGGTAISVTAGEAIATSVSLGGRGGGGATGGAATITNKGQVITYGPNAPGLKAKSVGGGGGHGGAALATAYAVSQAEVVPAVSVSVALGGAGGTGSTGGKVEIDNSGFVVAGGQGAQALVAQSIGGGGGYGGDSSSAAFSGGGGAFKFSANVSVGGNGGASAHGGTVTLSNSGFLGTYGQDAPAILAQSIGGGGGAAGTADGSGVTSDADKFSFSASINIGGTGAGGSTGGTVTVDNNGNIGTRGDQSYGVLAQSIGGGGGAGGGGAGSAKGDILGIAVAVGGKGGRGNDGGPVTVTNTRTIATSGFHAMGILAQSIGGGGGDGGKAAAVGGGSGTAPPAPALSQALSKTDGAKEIAPGVVQINSLQFSTSTVDPSKIYDFIAPRLADDVESPSANGLTLSAAVGGQAGAGGVGKTVKVANSGQITTLGAYSSAIFAQSVGGGGGAAGATTASSANDRRVTFSLALGGRGGSAGAGGDVQIDTTPGSGISTSGIHASGIFAQSIGGGGGVAAMSAATNEAGGIKGFGVGVAIGGDTGADGDGGRISVRHGGGTISTSGKNAPGIFAQSIGGGGGTARAASTDDTKRGAVATLEDKFNLSLSFGGDGPSSGQGGEVEVILNLARTPKNGTITTDGRMSHGVLAQSFGGFGGAALGGKTSGINFFKSGSIGAGGDGGQTTVTAYSDIMTNGDAAYGILAQSIGGGGALGGDLADIPYIAGPGGSYLFPFNPAPTGSGHTGNGGSVDILVAGGEVHTVGSMAPAIFAQSIGGGGGHIATPGTNQDPGIRSGTYGGAGAGGEVNITVGDKTAPGRVISESDDAISAQSDGGHGGSAITIKITKGSLVAGGGGEATAIRLRGGSPSADAPNIINNAGTIRPWYSSPDGGGLWVDQATVLNNTGTFIGEICGPGQVTGGPTRRCDYAPTVAASVATDRAVTVNNLAEGLVVTGGTLDLGTEGVLHNQGIVSVGGSNRVAETRLRGDLVHHETGTLLFDLDAENDASDMLRIDGTARLAGTVAVNPITLAKGTTDLLWAEGGITARSTLNAASTHLFSHQAEVSGSTLSLSTDADFTGADGSGRANASLARHLQNLWDTRAPGFGSAFAGLAGVRDANGYGDALDLLSGRAVSAVSAARLDASRRLVRSAFSCPTFIDDSAVLSERECTWFRIEGASFDKNSSNGSIDYDGTAAITMFGGQREIRPGWFLGGILGYENSQLDSARGATSVDGEAALVLLALKRQRGPLLLAGAVDLGYGWYDSRRNIDLAGNRVQARASTNSFNAGLHFRAAYQAVRDSWYLQPMIDLDMTYLQLDGYEESGAGALDLDVAQSDGIIWSATPAVKLGRRIDLKGGAVLNGFVSAGVSVFEGNDWDTRARFADASDATGGFNTTLNTPDVLGRLSAGIDVFNSGSVNLRAQLRADLAEDYRSQSAELRLRINF